MILTGGDEDGGTSNADIKIVIAMMTRRRCRLTITKYRFASIAIPRIEFTRRRDESEKADGVDAGMEETRQRYDGHERERIFII